MGFTKLIASDTGDEAGERFSGTSSFLHIELTYAEYEGIELWIGASLEVDNSGIFVILAAYCEYVDVFFPVRSKSSGLRLKFSGSISLSVEKKLKIKIKLYRSKWVK